MDPNISIIVPVYNVELYLRKCINSILRQSYKDFELIIVNDGSTDGSWKICEEYSKIDNRVKLINKVNGGLSSARNAGIEVAKGKYIAFVDSDDFIHINMYEILFEIATSYNSDIIMCDFKRVFDGDVPKEDIPSLNNLEIFSFGNIDVFDHLNRATPIAKT